MHTSSLRSCALLTSSFTENTFIPIATPTDTGTPYRYQHSPGYEPVIHAQSPTTLTYFQHEGPRDKATISTPPVGKNEGAFHDPFAVVGGRPIDVRRYSGEWWKRSWDTAIQYRVWPRLIYSTIFVLVIGTWLGGM